MLILQLTEKYLIGERSNAKGYCSVLLKAHLIRFLNWNWTLKTRKE